MLSKLIFRLTHPPKTTVEVLPGPTYHGTRRPGESLEDCLDRFEAEAAAFYAAK